MKNITAIKNSGEFEVIEKSALKGLLGGDSSLYADIFFDETVSVDITLESDKSLPAALRKPTRVKFGGGVVNIN